MKLIIAGSRHLNIMGSTLIYLSRYHFPKPKQVVSGGCEGVDQAGETFALLTETPIKKFYPDWKKYGKKAGPIRNKEMAEYADALLLIWDGKSKGSKSMKKEMMKLKKPIYEIILVKHNT